jgi:hypothetical protein
MGGIQWHEVNWYLKNTLREELGRYKNPHQSPKHSARRERKGETKRNACNGKYNEVKIKTKTKKSIHMGEFPRSHVM